MKKLLLTVVGLLFWVMPAAAFSVQIDQPKVVLEIAPGQSYTGEMEIVNLEDKEAPLHVYFQDWVYQEGGNGEKNFSPAGTLSNSASSWLTVTPIETMLKPYGKLVVRYTLNVPASASGGYNSVLFFETTLGSGKTEGGTRLSLASRIGSLFFVDVKGTVQRKGEVRSINIQASSQGSRPVEIKTTFKNTGNTAIVLSGNYILMDTQSQVRALGDLANIYTSPGTTGTATTQWVGRLPKGNYDALLTYELGGGMNQVEERTFTVE